MVVTVDSDLHLQFDMQMQYICLFYRYVAPKLCRNTGSSLVDGVKIDKGRGSCSLHKAWMRCPTKN